MKGRIGRGTLRASAGNLKKVGLELGGKNPQIVFADTDLDAAADGVVFGLAFNAGQCCVSGSRLVVERSIADDFGRRVVEKIGRLRVGDPLDDAIVGTSVVKNSAGSTSSAAARRSMTGKRAPDTPVSILATISALRSAASANCSAGAVRSDLWLAKTASPAPWMPSLLADG